MQNEELKIHIMFSIKILKVNKISLEVNNNGNHHPIKHQTLGTSNIFEYFISFSLPWQSYICDIQTVGTASPSTTEFFLLVKYGWRFHYAFFSVWSYKEIDVQFWLSAQTGHWLEFGPRDLGTGKPNLNHRKYNIVNL